ncbi:MAG: 2-isopropylmalate synthase, partial [Acidobacteriota bacterium]
MSREAGPAGPDSTESLVYDWGAAERESGRRTVSFCDETLREGLQSPSSRLPTVEERLEFLHLLGG